MGIAVADMLVMVEYIPFSIHMYIANYNNNLEKVCFKLKYKVLNLKYGSQLAIINIKIEKVLENGI